ncbi:MAG: hypothetical protein JW719_06020 [Pirellulales bacterium]|nr:hypothetical protein [Pirellulales bacterium]
MRRQFIVDAEHGTAHDVQHEIAGEDFGEDVARQPPPCRMAAPFVLLLGAIACCR